MEQPRMSDENSSSEPNTPEGTEASAPAEEEISTAGKGAIREILRNALSKARREHRPLRRRQELSRDRSKSVLLLASIAVALLMVFLGVFSAPMKMSPSARRNQPNLGRKVTPGREEAESGKSITPLLDASQQPTDAALRHRVTPEDVGRTSRSGDTSIPPAAATMKVERPSPASPKNSPAYALKGIDFSDPLALPPTAAGPLLPPSPDGSELKKPAIVFVRSTENTSLPASPPPLLEQNSRIDVLPPGTRLLARLEAPVSSAAAAPVVAVVEYNYEREGEIVLPAGAKVFGKLVEAHPSGFVGLLFEHIEMPDGSTEKIRATAMDLKYGPLKGYVSGKRSGRRFLVSSLSGLGTAAAYMVGSNSNQAFNGPLSENSLLRERVADNVGNAGQGELNQLSFNQNIVVTIPANTRFYLVLEEDGMDAEIGAGNHSTKTAIPDAGNGNQPTLEELRELIELRRELSQMYQQSGVLTSTTGTPPAQ